jgi:hypothetical protein
MEMGRFSLSSALARTMDASFGVRDVSEKP